MESGDEVYNEGLDAAITLLKSKVDIVEEQLAGVRTCFRDPCLQYYLESLDELIESMKGLKR